MVLFWAIWVLYWELYWELYWGPRRPEAERANSNHGPREAGGQQSKDERRGDRRGKQTHYLANPREREREIRGTSLPPCAEIAKGSQLIS
jgi:hypothetical protein